MWDHETIMMIVQGVGETLYMTVLSTVLGYLFGLPMGVLLAVSDKEGLKPNAVLYKILDAIANIVRSIPFLILLILLIPFTRAVVGKSYGSTATVVPLVVAAIPFIARMVESSIKEVCRCDRGSQSYGCQQYKDHREGSSGRSQNFTDHRSDYCDWNDPWLFSHVRCSRRRRTWRYRHPLWILQISVRYYDRYSYPAGGAGTDFPVSGNDDRK